MADIAEAVKTGGDFLTGDCVGLEPDDGHTGKPSEKTGTDELIREIENVGEGHTCHTGVAEQCDALFIRLDGLVESAVIPAVTVALNETVDTVGDVLITG